MPRKVSPDYPLFLIVVVLAGFGVVMAPGERDPRHRPLPRPVLLPPAPVLLALLGLGVLWA